MTESELLHFYWNNDRETYRSGHNENDSKSFDPQGSVGSNPTVSARMSASSRFSRLLAFLF